MALRRAAYSAGLEEPETKMRVKKNASSGKNPRYARTSQVAAPGESSTGRRRSQRMPLYATAEGARIIARGSSFPVLTRVAMDVTSSRNRETRKKNSAGKGAAFGNEVELPI